MIATPFSTLLERVAIDGDTRSLVVPSDWQQGRSVFGGLQAALALRAMRAHVPVAPLRTLQLTFVAPVDGTLHARATVLRAGRSATHVEARVNGPGGALATIAIGVFGTPRTSAVAVMPAQPAVPRPASPFELRYIPNVVPAFIQHFTATWLRGGPPFTGATERRHVIEVGMVDPAAATEAHAIALADFVPPLALTMLRTFANGSTLTWMLEFVTERFAHPLAGWRVDAELVAARAGYTSQGLELWAPDGTLVALGQQCMTVFG